MKSIKKDWLPNLIRDWGQRTDANGRGSPAGSPRGSPTDGNPKWKDNGTVPNAYKIIR